MHIDQLNGIDNDVIMLLRSAGQAVNALTQRSLPSTLPSQPSVLDSHKAQFSDHIAKYFSLVKEVGDALRSQLEALQQADSSLSDERGSVALESIINGGLGNLDAGWLNSRTDDVGGAKVAELLREATELLGKLEKKDDGPKT